MCVPRGLKGGRHQGRSERRVGCVYATLGRDGDGSVGASTCGRNTHHCSITLVHAVVHALHSFLYLDTRTAHRVTPSESKSLKLWPASATIAAERPTTPAKSLNAARERFTATPIHVMRSAARWFAIIWRPDAPCSPVPRVVHQHDRNVRRVEVTRCVALSSAFYIMPRHTTLHITLTYFILAAQRSTTPHHTTPNYSTNLGVS